MYSILKYLLNNPVFQCHYDDLLLSLYRAVVRSDINLFLYSALSLEIRPEQINSFDGISDISQQ